MQNVATWVSGVQALASLLACKYFGKRDILRYYMDRADEVTSNSCSCASKAFYYIPICDYLCTYYPSQCCFFDLTLKAGG